MQFLKTECPDTPKSYTTADDCHYLLNNPNLYLQNVHSSKNLFSTERFYKRQRSNP